jgi:NADPH:quinone reductase
MDAIRFERTGGPEVLALTTLDDPQPGPTEAVVEVAAAGVNFIDTYHRSGLYPVDLPSGLGGEGAGTVVAVGDQTQGVQVGDRVAWVGDMGSYASRTALEADKLVPVPDGLDLEVAAAVMLQGMTAHYLSHSTATLGSDDTVLVYAAAGGVGRLLVQLAKRRGARVLACTSTEEKAQHVLGLGADEVIRYRDVDIPQTVRDLTGGAGVDVVYDSVAADTWEDSLDSLRPRGLCVFYGNASGPVPPLDLQLLARKGSLFVTRPMLFAHIATRDELLWRATSLFDLITSGQLDVKIHERYPLSEAARAHADLESGTTSGKLLLIP